MTKKAPRWVFGVVFEEEPGVENPAPPARVEAPAVPAAPPRAGEPVVEPEPEPEPEPVVEAPAAPPDPGAGSGA